MLAPKSIFSSFLRIALLPAVALLGSASAHAQTPRLNASFTVPTSVDLTFRASAATPSGSSSSTLVDAPGELPTPAPSDAAAVVVRRTATAPPPHVRYGGTHEFNASVGYSGVSGPMWGYRQDVDVSLVHLRYSRVMKNGKHVVYSFSPELTPYIRLDEPVLDANDVEIARKHTTGGGASPVGFTFDFLPGHHVQPFLESNYGVLYFRDRVLSRQARSSCIPWIWASACTSSRAVSSLPPSASAITTCRTPT